MPFIHQEPFTFFNIKLTDHGRRAASRGKFLFSKIILSDREIDYSIDRDGRYNIFNNRILDINDFYPDVPEVNFDGGPNLGSLNDISDSGQSGISIEEFENNIIETFNVGTEKILVTGSTSSTTISNFIKGVKNLVYASNNPNWGTNKVTFAGGGYTPIVGDVVFIPWVSPNFAGTYSLNPNPPSNQPSVLSTYKIISAVSASDFFVDRPIPNFASGPTVQCQFFRDNMIESFYGSGKTSDPGIWNMNIVRTQNVMGTQISVINDVSGYTTFGSIEYNGTKKYFGFGNDLPVFGVIHYTNKWTGNTYGEQFVEGTFELDLPGIMWHHNYNAWYNNISANTFSSYNSSGTTWGLFLSDAASDTKYDPITKTTYRDLKDGRDSKSFSVGRVYHKLQLIIITDQELLTALTYKSNRNYTLPDFEISLTNQPAIGQYGPNSFPSSSLSGLSSTGLVEDGYDYFVTYIAENSNYQAGTSIGNAPSLPCGYIKKIVGFSDLDGSSQFLKVRFPNSDSFPYMRNDSELSAPVYRTGWNANTVQILVNKQPSSRNYNVADVPYKEWVRVSDKSLGGNGVFRAVDYGWNTIDPKIFNSYEFVISEEDFASGSTYTINSGLTANQSYLTFGDEYFVYGTIKTGIAASVFKTTIQAYVYDSDLNGSDNPTYDPLVDPATYITEIAILDTDNFVSAVGKPTYPILKNNIRWLTLQLDIDF